MGVHFLKKILFIVKYVMDVFRFFLIIGNSSTSIVMLAFSEQVINEYTGNNGVVSEATKLAFKNGYLASSLVNGIVMSIYYAISIVLILYLLGSIMVGDTALNISLSLALPGPLFGAAVTIGFPALQFVIYLFVANAGDSNYYLVAIASILASVFHFILLPLALLAEVVTFLYHAILVNWRHPDPDAIDKANLTGLSKDKEVIKNFVKAYVMTYVDFFIKRKVKTESQVVG